MKNWNTFGASFSCGLFVLIVASPIAAGVQSFERERPMKRWALLVHASDRDDKGATALARTLAEDYSFHAILGLEAEGKTWHSITDKMRAQVKPGDELVIYLSLPVRRRDEHVYFEFETFEEMQINEAPRNWVDLAMVVELLSTLPTVRTLLVFYSCAFQDTSEDRFLDQFSYAKRSYRGTVDVMRVCKLDDIKGSVPAADDAESALRRAKMTAVLAEALAEGPAAGMQSLDSQELARRLEERVSGFAVRVQSYPEFEKARFRFVPKAALNDYVARYGSFRPYQSRDCGSDCATGDLACFTAKSDCEMLREKERLAYEASESPRAILVELVEKARTEPTPGFSVQAATFLETVATDSRARLTQADKADASLVLDLRSLAVEGLGRLATPHARDALGRLAGTVDESAVRRLAVSQLGSMPEPRDTDRAAVRAALADPVPEVREAAVRSAVLLRDDEAAPAVSGLLLDPELTVRIAALQATSAMSWIEKRELVVELLGDPDAAVRREAAAALARLGPSAEATAALIELLNREENVSGVREAAAFALGRTHEGAGTDETVAALVAAAERGPDSVREAVAFSLGRIGGARAVSYLKDLLLEAEAEAIRIAAAEALRELRDPKTVPPLVQVLASPSAGLRRAAVAALSAVGTPEAMGGVAARLGDQDSQVRAEARRALEAAGDPRLTTWAVSQVLASADPPAKVEAIGMLCEHGGPASVDLVLGVLPEPNLQLHEAAIAELGCYRDPAAIGLIREALSATDSATRVGAAAALGQVDDDRALDALLAHIKSQDEALRTEVVRSLATKSDRRALEAVLSASHDQSAVVRAAAAQALGTLGRLDPPANPRSRERLESLATSDAAAEVRRAAIQALSGSRSPM